ncbi:unnamed protein product, partial [Staurois parvus]
RSATILRIAADLCFIKGHLCNKISSSHHVLESRCHWCRGGLTIWKLGHCPRAQGQ